MLLQIFFRQEATPTVADNPMVKSGFISPQTADQLLSSERRRVLLDLIWEQTSMSRAAFQTIYQEPIARYAELVQELPASENHHHAYRGGMLDHTLEVVLQALRLRQSYLLPPGAPPEDAAHQAEVWSAGVAYGALCHDVGKVAVDIEVRLDDGTTWRPWMGTIKRPYKFRYLKKRDPSLHEFAAGLLYSTILGTEIMNWLAKRPVLWGKLLYLLAGGYEKAEVLGEIVAKADRFSTALNIGGNPERIVDAPVRTQQKQWLLGLQALVKDAQETNRLNTKGQPFWLTQDSLWLVSQTIMNGLRSYLLKNGLPAPSNNNILFDELQAHGIIQATSAGRAIWKIRISDGTWSTELTCVKMKPSLIWGNEEPPTKYSGTIEILEEQGADNTATPVQEVGGAVTPTVFASATSSEPMPEDGIGATLRLLGDLLPNQTPSKQMPSEQISDPKEKPETHNIKPTGKQITDLNPCTNHGFESVSNSAIKRGQEIDVVEREERRKLALEFMSWLKASLASGRILVNEPNAKVHLVNGKAFLVSPRLFQRFCQEQTGTSDKEVWKRVQRGFERLKIHEKRPDDLNIWSCTVAGPRRVGNRIRGYLIDPALIMEEALPNNPFLTLDG